MANPETKERYNSTNPAHPNVSFTYLAVLHQDSVSPPKKRSLSPGGDALDEAYSVFLLFLLVLLQTDV